MKFHLHVKSLKKYGTNQPIYKTERDSQTQKRNLLPEGRGRGEDSKGIGENVHTAIFEMDSQEGPTVYDR